MYYRPKTVWTCNTRGKKIPSDFDLTIPRDVVQLNHYRAHSLEEFMILDGRNRASIQAGGGNKRTRADSRTRFSWYDNNTLLDIGAYNFWMNHVADADFSV